MNNGKVRKGWDWYRKQWDVLSGRKRIAFIIANYTILFLLLQFGVFFAFYTHGKSFVWKEDGLASWYPNLLYIRTIVRQTIKDLFAGKGLNIPLYDFSAGAVAQNLESLVFPEILVALFPKGSIDLFYSFLVVGSYYFAGLSFIALALHFKADPIAAITGSLAYSFCGFGLFAIVRHPSFGYPMIYLPLLIMGTDMVIKREKGFLLLIVTVLSLTRSLYFSCMQAIFCFLFAVVRFFDVYQGKRIREFTALVGRLFSWVGIAVLLSGVIVIPTLFSMTGSGRIGKNIFSFSSPFLYETDFYERFFSYYTTVTSGMVGGGSDWTRMGYTILSIPAICLLFSRRKKEERSLRILLLVLTVMLSVPAITYLMSGFNTLSNRFIFGYALCVSLIITFMISGLEENSQENNIKAGIFVVLYIVICELLISEKNRIHEAIVFLVVSIGILLLIRFLRRDPIALKTACLIITCVSILYSANMLFASRRNYAGEFIANPETEYDGNSQYQSLSETKAVSEDLTFFRATGDSIRTRDLNMSFYYGIKDLTGYSSAGVSERYLDWLNELEVPFYAAYNKLFGVNGRTSLLTLTNNKYFAVRNKPDDIYPFGYKEIKHKKTAEGERDTVYQNENWLPIGFTYDHYILREQYDSLTALEKQEIQLQAAVIEHQPVSGAIITAEPVSEARKIDYVITDAKDVSIKKNVLKVGNAGGTVTLTFEGLPACETYLRVVDLDPSDGNNTQTWTLTATDNRGASGSARFDPDYYVYSSMQHTQMINLGYSETGITSIVVSFLQKGTCKFGGFEVYCQPMNEFGDRVSKLGQEPLENIRTTGNSLEGTISVSADKLLCVAIPYLNDWTVYVDGEEKELYHVNTAFMGVELSAGEHTVRFVYRMRGFMIGIVFSIAGVLSLAGMIVYQRRRKRTVPAAEQ